MEETNAENNERIKKWSIYHRGMLYIYKTIQHITTFFRPTRGLCQVPQKCTFEHYHSRNCYRLDALPVTEPTVSKHWTAMNDANCTTMSKKYRRNSWSWSLTASIGHSWDGSGGVDGISQCLPRQDGAAVREGGVDERTGSDGWSSLTAGGLRSKSR